MSPLVSRGQQEETEAVSKELRRGCQGTGKKSEGYEIMEAEYSKC